MKQFNSLFIKYFLLQLVISLFQAGSYAQSTGSRETVSGYMAIAAGGTHASVGEKLYIGPGTYVVNGTWEVYSKDVWISPAAVISGSGTIRFYNPSTAGGVASPTLMDGNNSGNFINANMALHNASDMVLTDNAMTAAMTTAGWANTAGNASLSVGANYNFAVANGDVLTGNYDMTLNSSGTLSNYQENRFVVTAGTGHLVKQNYTGAFIYPVGMAAGDYTPAQITNIIANTFHVNVTNYAGVNSATFANAAIAGIDGVNRGWNIYADNAAGNSAVNLEHNDSTQGIAYSDISCFVTRLIGTRPNTAGDNLSNGYWESNTQAMGSGNGTLTTASTITTASERSRGYTTFSTSASPYISWYTKASNVFVPLPVTITSFSGQVISCGKVALNWVTAQEYNLLDYEIEQSNDAVVFTRSGTVAAYNNQTNTYSFTVAQNNAGCYYRLRITGMDGRYSYSNAVVVKMNCIQSFVQLYPQPFSAVLNIEIAGSGFKNLQVFDVSGRMVNAPYTKNGHIVQLDGTNLAAGVYVLHIIKNDGTSENVKAIKQ